MYVSSNADSDSNSFILSAAFLSQFYLKIYDFWVFFLKKWLKNAADKIKVLESESACLKTYKYAFL